MTPLALAVALLAQSGQYGYLPRYPTASLPTCNGEYLDRLVFDTTEQRIKRCDGASSWAYTVGNFTSTASGTVPASGGGSSNFLRADGTWAAPPAGGSGLPSGLIVLLLSGTCPTGFTEETSLSGKFVLGTVAANGDVGGTGGSDNITPAGTISSHSGTAVADHASHTHTYTDVLNHTHTVTVTDPGHTHTERAQGGTTASTTGTHLMTSAATGGSLRNAGQSTVSGTTGITASTANPAGGVATGTTAGPSAVLTHSVTQPSDHSFTGTQFDNRPAFAKVIFCRAN